MGDAVVADVAGPAFPSQGPPHRAHPPVTLTGYASGELLRIVHGEVRARGAARYGGLDDLAILDGHGERVDSILLDEREDGVAGPPSIPDGNAITESDTLKDALAGGSLGEAMIEATRKGVLRVLELAMGSGGRASLLTVGPEALDAAAFRPVCTRTRPA